MRPHLHCLCQMGRQDVALGGARGTLCRESFSSLGSSRAGCTAHRAWQSDGPWVGERTGCHLLRPAGMQQPGLARGEGKHLASVSPRLCPGVLPCAPAALTLQWELRAAKGLWEFQF